MKAVWTLTLMTLCPAASLFGQCGTVVTSNYTLTGDMGPCSGDGLIVERSNLTINLNGYRIYAVAGSTKVGINVVNGEGITIRNGRIQNFAVGVNFPGAGRSKNQLVQAITFTGGGVQMSQNSDNRILDCTFTGVYTAGVAIGVVESVRTKIRGNRISNYGTAITLSNSLQTPDCLEHHPGERQGHPADGRTRRYQRHHSVERDFREQHGWHPRGEHDVRRAVDDPEQLHQRQWRHGHAPGRHACFHHQPRGGQHRHQ